MLQNLHFIWFTPSVTGVSCGSRWRDISPKGATLAAITSSIDIAHRLSAAAKVAPLGEMAAGQRG